MSPDPSLRSIGQLSLLVRDIGRTEAFYRDVLRMRHLFTFGELTFFEIGGTRLFIRAVPEEEWRASSTLYFAVEDLEAAHRALGAVGVEIGAPELIHTHPDGTEEWMAFFADPDGNALALMSSRKPSR
jgi:predicted enzyme related to lactoylglutathione lyase